MMMNDNRTWLIEAHRTIANLGLRTVALASLDRPTLKGRVWTDGSLSKGDFCRFLEANADCIARNSLISEKEFAGLDAVRPIARAFPKCPYLDHPRRANMRAHTRKEHLELENRENEDDRNEVPASVSEMPDDTLNAVLADLGTAASSPDATGPALLIVPPDAPRFVALVSAADGTDLDRAIFLIGKRLWNDDRLEMAGAISESTGAALLLLDERSEEAVFVSRAAFQKMGITGAFLGLSCLNVAAGDAVREIVRQVNRGQMSVVKWPRRKRLGDMSLICLDSSPETAGISLAQSRFNLTMQERSEAESMVAGLSCKESAARLGLSPETVRQRRKIIYRKLGVSTCGQAAARIMGVDLGPTTKRRDVLPFRKPVFMQRNTDNTNAGNNAGTAAAEKNSPKLKAAS